MMQNNNIQFGKSLNPELKSEKWNDKNTTEDPNMKFSFNHKDKQKVYIVDTYDFDDAAIDNPTPFATFRATPAKNKRQLYYSNYEGNKPEVDILKKDFPIERSLNQENDFNKRILSEDHRTNIFGQVIASADLCKSNSKGNSSVKCNTIKKSQSTSKNVFKGKKSKPQVSNLEDKSFDSRSSSIHLIMKQEQL